MDDVRFYVSAQMVSRANNPSGVGWKKHDKRGRFVAKRVWYGDMALSFVIGLIAYGALLYGAWVLGTR